MEDSRTKPYHHSSGKCHHRDRQPTGSSFRTDMDSISPAAADAKSCGAGVHREARSESSNTRIRGLQEHLTSDSRTHSQRQAVKGFEKAESVEKDFMKHLGLAEGSADNVWSRRRSASKAGQKSANQIQTDPFGSGIGPAGGSHHVSYAASFHSHPVAPPLNTLPPIAPPTPPLPPPPPLTASPSAPTSQQQQSDNFEDFKKYLGLSEGSADNFWSRRRSAAKASQKSAYLVPSDRLSSNTSTALVSHHVRYPTSIALSSHPISLLPTSGPQTPPHQQPHHQHQQMADEFSDEQNFFLLVEQMLGLAEKTRDGVRLQPICDTEAVVNSLRRFSTEFGDSVCHFHRKRPDAFPFYQPEMLKMLDLLNGTFGANSSDLEVFSDQLRSIHLSMRLFLHPADTLAEVNDAALTRLLLAYSEQLDRDLRSLPLGGGGGAASAAPEAIRYARRRAAALAAAVGRYARTVERRRQLVLGRMQSLAATVMGFVARCPPSSGGGNGGGVGGGEGVFRKAVVDLFDDMLMCFSSLGGTGGGGGSCSVFSGSNTELSVGRRSRAVSPTVHSEEGFAGGCGDTLSASSRLLPPPPTLAMLMPPSDNEEAASVASVDIDGSGSGGGGNFGSGLSGGVEGRGDTVKDDEDIGCDLACSPDASVSASPPDPLESLSLQLMERLASMFSSFLPNERVNNQEFKSSVVALYDWWRRASVGCTGVGGINAVDRRVTSRMAIIREQFNCTQRHRADSSGLKRLCSEADTAWDLIEVAKLMLPAEERSSALVSAHTAPDMREAAASLVDSVLATLYLYQTAQDASVLSTRLRADLQRLVHRLADCGPVPLLWLLRLRIMYLRARQYSDLLRAHPQGCLILELAQTHRILRRYEYPDGSVPLSLTICVPLNDYQKFFQHIKDMRVISFEARAPVTEKTSLLMKASCLKKIEKCCQCTIELQQPSTNPANSGSASASPMATTATGGSATTVATQPAEDAMTMGGGGGRRKPQLVVGSSRPNLCLVVRPDASNGRANAAMRMINDIVGPASIGDRVKYCSFHLSVSMPANYRPLTIFADTSRPLSC